MKYRVRFEVQTTLTDAQIRDLLDRAQSVTATTSPGTGQSTLLELTYLVDADNGAEAIVKATHLLEEAAAGLRPGRLQPAHRVVVEDPNGPSGYPFVSTAGVAQLLGVSDARVRPLAQRPDFPKPLDIPGLAGAVYVRSAIQAWNMTWDRDNPGGRPRKADS